MLLVGNPSRLRLISAEAQARDVFPAGKTKFLPVKSKFKNA